MNKLVKLPKWKKKNTIKNTRFWARNLIFNRYEEASFGSWRTGCRYSWRRVSTTRTSTSGYSRCRSGTRSPALFATTRPGTTQEISCISTDDLQLRSKMRLYKCGIFISENTRNRSVSILKFFSWWTCLCAGRAWCV